MRPKIWDNISDEAKDLVKKMLKQDQNDRVTSKEALQHPWLRVRKTFSLDCFTCTLHDVVNTKCCKVQVIPCYLFCLSRARAEYIAKGLEQLVR